MITGFQHFYIQFIKMKNKNKKTDNLGEQKNK